MFLVDNVPNINKFGAAKRPNMKKTFQRSDGVRGRGGLFWRSPWKLFMFMSPLPNISTLAILISRQKIPPEHQNGGPQNEFTGIPRTEGFCGNSSENLNFPEFHDLGFWGPHFQCFGGK